MTPIKNAAVARAFAAYPPRMRRKLMGLRELIFKPVALTYHNRSASGRVARDASP